MQNKNIIRLVESFILLPVLTMSMPLGSVPNPSVNISPTPYSVLSEKVNIEAKGLFAFNHAEDQKAKILEAQAQAIDEYFRVRNLPLEGHGKKMAEEASKYDLDYRLMPAIAMIETTGGKFLCKKLPKDKNQNPFGWGSCHIGFSSFDEAIEVIAKNLSGNNPNTAHHYDGKTIREILEKYNPPKIKPGYAVKVMKVMGAIGPEQVEITPSESASSYAPLVQIM